MERLVRIAFEDLFEHRAVKGVVPGFILSDVGEHLGQFRLVLPDDLAGLAVGELGGPLLDGGVDEDSVGIAVPVGVEAAPKLLELHLLDLPLIEQAGVASVVVEHLPVPVLFCRPEIVPQAPEALVAEVHR